MSDDRAVVDSSLTLSLPARFVLDRVLPTPGELAYGYRLAWITPEVAVSLALAGLGVVPDPPTAYEELALLLSDRFDQVPDLMNELEGEAGPTGRDARVWLFLALSWIYDHRTEFSDPFSNVEQLYDDFDYPEEIEGFVRFLPVAEGVPTGAAALYGRWSEYLEAAGAEYRRRSPGRD